MKGIKTGGRQKGGKNKLPSKTKAVNRQAICDFLAGYINNEGDEGKSLQKDWELLEPKDRVSMAEKMMQYTLPKIQSVQFEPDDDGDTKETDLEIRLRMLSKPKK